MKSSIPHDPSVHVKLAIFTVLQHELGNGLQYQFLKEVTGKGWHGGALSPGICISRIYGTFTVNELTLKEG